MDFIKQRKIEIIDNCPKCKGKNSMCECYQKYALDFKKHSAKIPYIFYDLDYSKIKLEDYAFNTIQEFLKGNISGLYLEGGSKTFRAELICSIMIEQLKQNKSCFFIDSLTCAQIVTSKWYDSSALEYDKLMLRDLVAFNDVGDERRPESKVVEDAFDNVIRERLFFMKQIIISSSLSIEQFAAIYTKSRYELIARAFKVISFPKINIKDIFKDIRK